MASTRERRGNLVQSPSGRLLVVNLTKLIGYENSRSWQSHLAIGLKGCGAIESVSTAFESISNIVCAFTGRMDMPSKLKSLTTTKVISRRSKQSQRQVARRLPANRPPTHPGEMLLEEFLKPLGISQSAFAARLGISFPRLNEIIRAKRGVTPDTALRLAHVLGMSADFWLGLQQDWELWHALRSKKAAAIARLEPLRHAG
jgi:addiction module HigA family antidote